MKSPNDFMLKPAHTEAEYQALAAELADWQRMRKEAMAQATFNRNGIDALEVKLAAEHMAHSVTIAEEHESRTAFQERIAQLEAALRWALRNIEVIGANDGSYSEGIQACRAALSGARIDEDIVATYSPCCRLIRLGKADPSTCHSGLCLDNHKGKLGPTWYLARIKSAPASGTANAKGEP